MRLRRKKNLDARIHKCKHCLIPTVATSHNALEAVKDKSYIDYGEIFGNSNKVEMEIGCGMGKFICQKATQNPNINFIGVEKITNVMVVAMEKAATQQLANVKFLNVDAVLLPKYIKPSTISQIYLNFPTPLPQKRRENTRLTSARYLEIYKQMLTQDGRVYQKTDDMHLYEYSLEQFSQHGFVLENISLDLHNGKEKGNIITEHENKFSQMGLPIYKLEASIKG